MRNCKLAVNFYVKWIINIYELYFSKSTRRNWKAYMIKNIMNMVFVRTKWVICWPNFVTRR